MRKLIDTAFYICVENLKQADSIRRDFDEQYFELDYDLSIYALKNLDETARKQEIEEIENLTTDFLESGIFSLRLNRRNIENFDYDVKQYLLWLRFTFPKAYAENHAGICFIYETENIGGREFINLAAKKLEVNPVKYTADVIEKNFFDAIANNGKIYDEDYREKFYRKIPAWNYEREYRIFLEDRFYRYGDKNSRTLNYNLETLKGIIFGLKTPLSAKLELIQKLQRRGKNALNFEFFQAEYDDTTQIISIREKSLFLKI